MKYLYLKYLFELLEVTMPRLANMFLVKKNRIMNLLAANVSYIKKSINNFLPEKVYPVLGKSVKTI